MAKIKQEIIRFIRRANVIEVLITKERGKPEVVTSTLTEPQKKFLKLKETDHTWKSYAQASAKLRAYGWNKEETPTEETPAKEKDEDYELAISEIRSGIGYGASSTLTSMINKLCKEYNLSWEEVKDDIGIKEW